MRNVMRGGVMRGGVMLGGVMRSQRGGFDPLTLFSAGQQGGYYDTSDASVRYIERTGASATTPAGVGDPLGTMLDTSPNANHVTAPSDAARPTVGDDGVVHAKPDGVDDVLIGPSLDGIGFPWTLGVWLNPAAFGVITQVLCTHVTGSGYNGIALSVQTAGEVAIRYGIGEGIGSGSRRTYLTTSTLSTGQWAFILAECRGYDDLDIYFDNVAQPFVVEGTAATVSFAGGNIELMAETLTNGFSPHKQGRTYLIRDTLTEAERTQLLEYGP